MASRSSFNALRQRSFTKTSYIHHTFSADLAQVEPLTIPPIADIFDAPARLGSDMRRQLVTKRSPGASSALPTVDSTTSTRFQPPRGLPPPLVFEGPARKNRSLLLWTKPPRASADIHMYHHSHTSIPFSIDSSMALSDDIAMRTYDGPSKITRYRYSGQKRKNDDGRTPLLAMAGMATLAVGATFVSSKESS
ncbi:hypothetical protein GYMLUDRAFT_91791 [Collybiopsis luxurians FD-317 M1]|nr:hypothetical protein GYMLUDRAFT_91791 [Collybiopsis luxurians FD-317 M1]